MTADGPFALRSALTRDDLPAAFHRWRTVLPAGASRPTEAGEWAGALVLVERGTLAVECTLGGERQFATGDLLALGWLPLRTLHNRGSEPVELLAVRRRGALPTEPLLHVISRAQGVPSMKFTTRIELGGTTATGFRVPDEVVEALGSGKRPAVRVTIGSHTYRSTVAVMNGVFMLPLAAEHREAAGVVAGDTVEVTVELDTAPREIAVPADLAAALDADPDARRTFDALSYSNRRYHVESVTGAKTDETRQRHIAKAVATLHDGRPR